MKKTSAVIIGIFFLLFFSAPLYSQNKIKILVLGTYGERISDLEDRLLRETVMRELLKKGFDIVPVMELEDEVQQNGLDLRKVPPSTIKSLTEKYGASLCISGSIEKRAHNDLYLFNIYDQRSGKAGSIDLAIKKETVFQTFCAELAITIAEKTAEFAGSPVKEKIQEDSYE